MTRTVIGWVAGIEYSDGHEWLLQANGDTQSLWYDQPKQHAKVCRTKEEAEKLLAESSWSKFYPGFVREYWRESYS